MFSMFLIVISETSVIWILYILDSLIVLTFVHYFMFVPLSEWTSLIAVLSPPLLYFVLRSLNLFLLFSGIPGDNGDKFTCLIIDVNRAVT